MFPSMGKFSLFSNLNSCHHKLILFQSDSEVHVHWKGAAEVIVASCISWLDTDGKEQPMTPDKARSTGFSCLLTCRF